jgi:hypothetical protein
MCEGPSGVLKETGDKGSLWLQRKVDSTLYPH